jgi:two-component system, OmpR family, response regulator BaeR
MRVLVTEDDARMAGLLGQALTEADHEVRVVGSGERAIDALGEDEYDLVLLDVMLPRLDGFATCRRLRDRGETLGILMLTARDDVHDRVRGLDAGADDYLCKPFSVRELVARVKALLRRPRVPSKNSSLVIDEATHKVSLDGKNVDLTPVEFRLLAALAATPGRVFPRDRLLEKLYADHRVVTDRTVDAHVKNLRRKLDEIRPGADLVRSIYGVGYKLELE